MSKGLGRSKHHEDSRIQALSALENPKEKKPLHRILRSAQEVSFFATFTTNPTLHVRSFQMQNRLIHLVK